MTCAAFDTYERVIIEKSWRYLLRPGDRVIIISPGLDVLARRSRVERITHTGLIVVNGRHYEPDTGNAVTRRGFLEQYSEDRWAELYAAADAVMDAALYRIEGRRR